MGYQAFLFSVLSMEREGVDNDDQSLGVESHLANSAEN